MYTLDKTNTSHVCILCILCTLMPQIISLSTLTLVHTWYKESHPPPPPPTHTHGFYSFLHVELMTVKLRKVLRNSRQVKLCPRLPLCFQFYGFDRSRTFVGSILCLLEGRSTSKLRLAGGKSQNKCYMC